MALRHFRLHQFATRLTDWVGSGCLVLVWVLVRIKCKSQLSLFKTDSDLYFNVWKERECQIYTKITLVEKEVCVVCTDM